MHQDWLVVSGAAELEEEEEVSPDEDEDDDALGVLVAAGDEALLATVCAPIDPS
jgi:hypothetical protein